jgi:large subunit ribosomal protein L6
MSRIGKKPIIVPEGVNVLKDEAYLKVEGPKGHLSRKIPEGVDVVLDHKVLTVEKVSDSRQSRSNHGLIRTLIGNMVTGVSAGFEKGLEISGVGYRAEAVNDTLKLVIGYSSPIEYRIPEGIAIRVDKQVNVFISGIDKQLVGKVAAEVRALRKPEPYKGKGIKYAGEIVRRKVGKSVGS